MDQINTWLLSGEPYIRYRTLTDLFHLAKDNPEVLSARQNMLAQPELVGLISTLREWPGKTLNSHKSAGQLFHTLNFLADLGINIEDSGIREILDKVMAHQDSKEQFCLPMNIGAAHGGTGNEIWAWALCDAPNLVYALTKMGLGEDERVIRARTYLIDLVEVFGWPCAVSPALGSFRGPGRKTDPCPYANLVMLKILGLFPEYHQIPATQIGIETLLTLWQTRLVSHPYIFYMGTDFCKLKAPLIWYDILHVLDALSMFPGIGKDPRFQDMFNTAMGKCTPENKFIPESIYLPYKEWEFGQKKQPSRWITFLMQRIRTRVYGQKTLI